MVHLVGKAMKQQPASCPTPKFRGLIRRWKEELAQLYGIFERADQNTALHEAAIDLCRKTSPVGRRHAFDKLARAFGAGAVLEGLRLDGDEPLACGRFCARAINASSPPMTLSNSVAVKSSCWCGPAT